MKNVFLSAAASGGLNEPLLSTQALDRAFSPLQAQASYYFMYRRAILCTFQIAVDFYYVRVGWRGGGGAYNIDSLPPLQPSLTHAHVWYIKLPMYLFFYMRLVFSGFEGGKSITRTILEGGGRP